MRDEETTMPTVERAAYFTANLKDKPGALLKVMQDLKAKNVGLAGLWGFSTSGRKAQLYVVAKNPRKLRAAWKKAGLLADSGTGFFLKGGDRTGALIPSLEALSKAKINIVAIDAISVAGRYGSFVWVDKKDVSKAAKALGVK
jgi:hypothetical protein